MRLGTRSILHYFGKVPLNPLHTGFFSNFLRNLSLLPTLWKNKCTDFHEISGQVGYETRNNLEHFEGVAFNPLDPGSIFLFSGSVFDSDIMEKRVNGFS